MLSIAKLLMSFPGHVEGESRTPLKHRLVALVLEHTFASADARRECYGLPAVLPGSLLKYLVKGRHYDTYAAIILIFDTRQVRTTL